MNGSDGPGRADALEELLAAALFEIEEHGAVDVRALCRGREELIPELERAIEAAGHLGALHAATRAFDPLVGQRLAGRYRVERRIGAGAMGIVCEAYDESLGRKVAVKLLRPEIFADAQVEARLEREALSLAKIRHDSVVKIFDRGRTEDGQAYFVMDLLVGTTLADLIDARDEDGCAFASSAILASYQRMLGGGAALRENDLRQSVQWIIEAADAIASAHEAGIIHRDIKPSNIFIEASGRAVVLDFGIVSLSSKATLSLHESAIGTPAYMAPEQLGRQFEPAPQTDVYGLSATLYHLLTGAPPFEGTPSQVLAKLQSREPAPADQRRPGLPRDLLAILEKGMAVTQSNRYASAAELRDDLQAFLEYRPVSARRASRVERVFRRLGRSTVARTALASLVVVALGLGAYVWSVRAGEARLESWFAELEAFPPSILSGGPPEFRAASAVTRSEDVAALLSRLVENGSAPLTSRAWRAVHHLDRGENAQAAQDLEVLAQSASAPLTAWYVEQLRADKSPDLSDEKLAAPEPQGEVDAVVAACLLLRGRGKGWVRAQALIEALPDGKRPPGYEEILLACRLNAMVRSREALEERLARWRALTRDVEQLVGRRGYRSAVMGHVVGNALYAQRRFAEARAALRGALSLAPEDPAPRITLGGLLNEIGSYDAAIETLRKAIELQPRTVRSREQLAKSLAYLRFFDSALEVVGEIPYDESRLSRGREAKLRGEIAFIRAATVSVDEGGMVEAARKLAREAREHFLASQRFGLRTASFDAAYCDFVLGRHGITRAHLLMLASRDALNPYRLRHLASLMTAPLDASEVNALRDFLQRQAELRLAEDDEANVK